MPLFTMEAAVGMRYVITEPISFFCSGWQACVMKPRDHCVSQKPSKGLPTCSTYLGLTPKPAHIIRSLGLFGSSQSEFVQSL